MYAVITAENHLTLSLLTAKCLLSSVPAGERPVSPSIDDLFSVSGTGSAKVLALGYDTKNQLKVNGTHLEYVAYDAVQANGDLVLDFDQTQAKFFPQTSGLGWRQTIISRSDTSLSTYKISLGHKQGLILGGTSGSAPSSATDTGTKGTITWDTNYIYVCVATNTWKRVAISTW